MDFPFSVSSEDAQALETLLEILDRLQSEDVPPFPYADIRHIYKTEASRKIRTRRAIEKGFIPDLAMYFADIYGCSGWNPKVPKNWVEYKQWPKKRQLIVDSVSREFFERYLVYLPVRRWITAANTPHLYRKFVIYEEMRVNVLALIRLLDKLQNAPEKP